MSSAASARPLPAIAAGGLAGVALLTLALGACGSGGGPSSPMTPTQAPTPTPDPATTIVLKPTGVTPKSIDVPLNSRVTFWNQDVVTHNMASDPHPIHTDCPPINIVSVLAPGESRATDPLTVARTCGYHDHDMPTNTLFQGTIVIH